MTLMSAFGPKQTSASALCLGSVWMLSLCGHPLASGTEGRLVMTTERTPINRRRRGEVTLAALEAFRKMQRRLERRCTCDDDHRECRACEEWWQQQSILHDELRLKPWQWPAYQYTGGTPPESAQAFEPDGGPVARYRTLKQAA